MMQASQQRVLLLEEITCTLEDGTDRVFPEPWLRRADAEQRCDAFLRQLRGRRGAWRWHVRVQILAEQGLVIDTGVVIDERFQSIRQSVAESLLAEAHEPGRPIKVSIESAILAQRLLGRPLARNERPPVHSQAVVKPTPALMGWTRLSTVTRPSSRQDSTCACGMRGVPHLRAHQRGRPVMVLALHTANAAEFGPGLCAYVARMWALIDLRDPTPLHAAPEPQEIRPLIDRSQWLEGHLARVPPELGGPQAGQLRRILTALDGQAPEIPGAVGDDTEGPSGKANET